MAVLLTTAVFLTTPITESHGGYDFDGVFYAAMAGSPQINPAYAHIAPWCYRLLTPALVHALPFATLTGFRCIAFVSDIGSLWLLFVILRRLRFSDGLALFGVLLYAGVFWTLRFSFYSPAYIDHQTQLGLLVIIYLTLAKRYRLAAIALAIGALQKESLAAFAVFSAAHLLRERRWRVTGETATAAALLIGLPAASLAAVRLWIPAENSFSAVQATIEQLQQLRTAAFWPVFVQSLFSGLGLLPILLIVRPRAWIAFLARAPEWIVYAAVSVVLVFGGLDKARLLLYALPLAVLMALCVAQSLYAESGLPLCVALGTVALAVHGSIGGYFAPMGTFDEYLARLVPEHSSGRYVPHLVRNSSIAAAFLIVALSASAWTRRRAQE